MTNTGVPPTRTRSAGNPPTRAGRIARTSRPSSALAWYAAATAVVAVLAIPVLAYHAQAFYDGAAGIHRLFTLPGFGATLMNTVVLALGSTIIAVVLAVALAKAVLHVPPWFRGVASIVPLLPLINPPVAIVIGWAFIFSPSVGYGNALLRELPFFSGLAEGPLNVYSMPAIILITGLDLTGVVFLLVSARLREIRGPLEAAARLAGATGIRSFLTITLPLLRPSLIAGVVVAFLLGLGQFTAPLLLGSRQGIDVVTTQIFQLREAFPIDYGATAALGLPLLVLGVVAVVFQRWAIGDQRKYVTQTGGASGVAERNSVWASVLVVGYALGAVVLPLAAIVLVAVSPYWSADLGAISFTTEHMSAAASNPVVRDAIVNTVITSVVAVVVAIPLGLLAALAMTGPFRAPRPAQYALDIGFQIPLAVPRAVLGLSVLFVFLGPPFSMYGTPGLFIIGYVLVVLPFALRAQQGSLVGISPSLFEAARISGAGRIRTIAEIALPLLRRGIVAGATLMLILLSHDFAVSVMVRSPGMQVMGTQLFEFWENGVFPQVAVMSLIMAVATGLILAVTLLVGGRSALRNL